VRYKETLPHGARVFESRVRAQWCDVDVAGIVYFAAYWRFVERAEMDLFRELGFPYDRVFQDYGFWLPRIRCEAEYHAPAIMDDWLRLRTHVERVGVSSVRWKTVVFNERSGVPGAEFALTVACIGADLKKSRPLPPAIRSALVACLAPETS
jgi:acyl-CoA thioester hydrolase